MPPKASTKSVVPIANVDKLKDLPPKAPRVSIAQYVRNVKQELAKVSWPSKKETKITTLMVFIMVIISAMFFFIVDQLLSYGIRLILGLGA
jgi:preprotein translocase subunit SecE